MFHFCLKVQKTAQRYNIFSKYRQLEFKKKVTFFNCNNNRILNINKKAPLFYDFLNNSAF